MKCLRPDCQNELHSGTKYCSTKCNALDRKRIKAEKASNIVIAAPKDLVTKLEGVIGAENTALILGEVNKYLLEDKVSIPLPLQGQTYGDLVLSYDGTKEYRPATTLSFDVIDKMLRSGPVIFAMEMKRAQVFRVFSGGRYKVISPDTELAEVAQAALDLIMPKMMHDVTWSAFAYGTSFSEEVWEWKTKEQLGMKLKDTPTEPTEEDTAPKPTAPTGSGDLKAKFLVPKVPNAVNPCTVDHIRRNPKDQSFEGFQQKRYVNGALTSILDEPVEVNREQALVIPLNEHFRNLWGESTLKPMYTLWLWYEIVFRTMVRYMDRMAIPWKVMKAPGRQTVTVSGSSAPVRAMDLALAIGTNLDKSGTIAIPSDVDENGKPLWDISLLTAENRTSLFLEVLQYLGQEMIRAALSADRSLSQSSGGVGSYNIGEVHAAASAVTSEMILLQILHYLNMYFMPEFSLYNRGQDGPPIWLRTQSIDTTERDMLMALIGVAGNSPAAQELFYMVDWRILLETSNIPALSKDDAKKLKDQMAKEAEEKMKTQQEIMAQGKAPVPTGGASAFPEKNTNKPAVPAASNPDGTSPNKKAEGGEDIAIALENIFTHQIPWMLGEHEAQVLFDNGLISDEVVRLFNPFHSRADGKFTSGPGGGGSAIPGAIGGGGSPDAGRVAQAHAAKGDTITQARNKSGSVLKTTGKILGLTGLGLVGLAVIGATANTGDSFDQNMQDRQREREQKAQELQQKLNELTKDWPKTNSPEESFNVFKSRLQAMGLNGMPPDLKFQLGSPTGGQGGYYDSATNTFILNAEIARSLQDGDPVAVWGMVHEIAHSNQEVDEGRGDFTGIPGGFDTPNFRDYFEGQNDLVTSVAMSKLYGKPFSQAEAMDESNSGVDLQSRVAATSSNVSILNGNQIVTTELGYPEQSAVWASIAVEESKKSGGSPIDYLVGQHANGADGVIQHQILNDLFPSEMNSGGFNTEGSKTFPSMSEVRDWMSNHGYVSPELAYEQMLKEAAGE